MKKLIIILFMALLLTQVVAVSALTASEARDEWRESKQVSQEKREAYRNAKANFAGEDNEGNRKAVVDSGKEVLHAALNEVEAWLTWKELEAEADDIPDDLKETIKDDVDTNKAKIADLRTEVDGVENQLGLGIVFLKMIGKYGELLTDVARDTGKVLVYRANNHVETIESLEARLRVASEGNDEAIAKLDDAKEDIEEAKSNIETAEEKYNQVQVGSTPLINFAEGNNYMRTARTNMLSAHANIREAFREIMK